MWMYRENAHRTQNRGRRMRTQNEDTELKKY